MQIHYQFIAAAAIALIAGVGPVSADELSVADTAGDASTTFEVLNGIATMQISEGEMAGIIGSFFPDTDVDIDGPQSIMLYTSHGKAYVDIIGYESYHKLGR